VFPFLFQDKEGILGLKRRWKRKSSVTAGKTWLTVDSYSGSLPTSMTRKDTKEGKELLGRDIQWKTSEL